MFWFDKNIQIKELASFSGQGVEVNTQRQNGES